MFKYERNYWGLRIVFMNRIVHRFKKSTGIQRSPHLRAKSQWEYGSPGIHQLPCPPNIVMSDESENSELSHIIFMS